MKSLVILLMGSVLVMAGPKKGAHREMDAHEHGHGDLSIAFEGGKGVVEFHSPSEAIYGFEHQAGSDLENRQMREGIKRFETNFPDMVVFDPALKCVFSQTKSEVKPKERAKHSDFNARYELNCEKPLVGSAIKFNFTHYIPGLQKVEVALVADNVQKKLDVGSKEVSLDVK